MTELPNVATRLEALGIPYPEGLAFLPSNIFKAGSKEELYYPKLIPDLERALEGQNLPVERLTPSSERAYVESRGVEWILWFSGEIVNVESESKESGRTFNAVIYSAHRLRGI